MEKREPHPGPRRRLQRPPGFRIGDVLSKTFSVWGSNLGTLMVLMVIAYSPWLAYSLYRVAEPAPNRFQSVEEEPGETRRGDREAQDTHPEAGAGTRSQTEIVWEQLGSWDTWREPVIAGLVQSFLGYLAQAIVIFAVFRRLRGERATVAESMRGGLSRFPAVVGASLVATLLYLVPWAALLGLAASVWDGGLRGVLILLVAAPFAIAAALWILVVLWVAIPAVVVERRGVEAALRRSMGLTKGRRIHIFLLLMIVGLIGAAAGGVAGAFSAFVPVVGALLVLVVTLAASALGATLVTVGYQALREEKEGADLPDLIEVFA